MKKQNILKLIIVLILGSAFFYFINTDDLGSNKSFQFNYDVILSSNNNDGPIEVWIPIPSTNNVQTITDIKLENSDFNCTEHLDNVHNNKYYYCIDEDGLDKEVTIKLSFNVLRFEHGRVNYKNLDIESYLQPSTMVPVGDIFTQIITDNNLNKEKVREIYNFVLTGMHYGKPKSIDSEYYNDPWLSDEGEYGMKGVSRDSVVYLYEQAKIEEGTYTFGNGNSLYACDIGVGNCTDYHSYFMSLGRTMDIPVRFHMGFPIPNEAEGKVGGYHCWADYFVDGEGWYPVDISEADKDNTKKEYFFGTVCKNRVEMMVGRDFKLEEYDQGLVNLFIYPLMEVDDKKSDGFSKHFSYKNL